MVFIPNSGVNFSSPYDFLKSEVASGSLGIRNSSLTLYASTVADFWTQLDIVGASDDTNFTANTYKTILSVSSGPGLLNHVIGPTSLAGTPTTTFGIAIDGAAEIEVPVTLSTTTRRAVLGPVIQNEFLSTSNYINAAPGGINASKSVLQFGGAQSMPSPQGMRFLGTPALRWRNSITVRIKTSENNSTTTNRERSSGCAYMLGVSV
jgi:hypothetical protein